MRRPEGLSLTNVIAWEWLRAEPVGDCRIGHRSPAMEMARVPRYVSYGGRMISVPRLILMDRYQRDLADGEQANHTCHRPACVNPDHIYLGTQRDNVHDMVEAGRVNPKSQIPETDMEMIEMLVGLPSVTNAQIMNQFGVCWSTVTKARKRVKANA